MNTRTIAIAASVVAVIVAIILLILSRPRDVHRTLL